MPTMQEMIVERADAYMRHCVAGVTKGGKGKARAFAICKAGGNKAGYYQPGTKQQTAKGRRAIRAHGRDAAAKTKDAAYKQAIKGEGTMSKMSALIERLEESNKKDASSSMWVAENLASMAETFADKAPEMYKGPGSVYPRKWYAQLEKMVADEGIGPLTVQQLRLFNEAYEKILEAHASKDGKGLRNIPQIIKDITQRAMALVRS